MSVPKLQVTKNYRLFVRSIDNRPLSPKKHKRLLRSIQEYGFLPCYPLAVVRDKQKNLVVFDGQHRLALAETLNLAVYYVECPVAFDIAKVNCTQEKWATKNFAETYAAKGLRHYQDGLEFAARYGLPVGLAFGLLAGTASWNNIAPEYYSGRFTVTDADYAAAVGATYAHLVHVAPQIKHGKLLEACMAVARVDDFDVQRLYQNAERCREKLVPFGTRDAYLQMLEDVYNYGRQKLVPLRISAIQAMRSRNIVSGNGSGKAEKATAAK